MKTTVKKWSWTQTRTTSEMHGIRGGAEVTIQRKCVRLAYRDSKIFKTGCFLQVARFRACNSCIIIMRTTTQTVAEKAVSMMRTP
jgi:hypothetical protein